MPAKWQLNFVAWPDWIKLMCLVALTVSTMAITVIIFIWLIELIKQAGI